MQFISIFAANEISKYANTEDFHEILFSIYLKL